MRYLVKLVYGGFRDIAGDTRAGFRVLFGVAPHDAGICTVEDHRHPFGEPCNERCEVFTRPAWFRRDTLWVRLRRRLWAPGAKPAFHARDVNVTHLGRYGPGRQV